MKTAIAVFQKNFTYKKRCLTNIYIEVLVSGT